MDQSEAGHLGKEDLSLGQKVLNNMTQTPLVEYMYCICTVIIPDVCDVLHWGGCSTKKCVDMWLPPHNGVCYSNFHMCTGGRFWKNVVQKENRKKKKKTSTSKYESYFTVQSTCLELIIQNLKISWGCHPSRMMEKPKTLQYVGWPAFFYNQECHWGVGGGGRAGVCSAYSGLKYSTPIGWGRRVANLVGKIRPCRGENEELFLLYTWDSSENALGCKVEDLLKRKGLIFSTRSAEVSWPNWAAHI
jgi:hypothetical protein